MRLVLVCIIGLIVVVPAAGFQESIRLRMSNYLPLQSVAVSKIMAPWSESIENKSAGRIKFVSYYGGALGRGPHRQYLLTEKGVSDVSFVFLSMHSGRFRDAEVLEMPGLTNTGEEASILAWKLFEEGLLSGFEHVKVLALFASEPGRLFTQRPVRNLSDYKGLKIRAAGQVQGEYVYALGATPEVLDAATATEALRRGTINGLIQGWSGLAIFHQSDFVDYFVEAPVGVLTFAIIMNKERFESLPDEMKTIIDDNSGLALSRRAWQAYDAYSDIYEGRFKENGAVIATPMDAELRAALQAKRHFVINDWVGDDSRRARLLDRSESIIKAMR